MIQDRNHDERQGFAGLLRPCACVAEKLPLIDGVEKQPVCWLSCGSESLPLIRSIGQDYFVFGKLSQSPVWSQNNMAGKYVTEGFR
jgi:hypothetical protein